MLGVTFLPIQNSSRTLYSIATFISGSHGCAEPFDLWSLDCQFCIVTGVLSTLQQMFLTAVQSENSTLSILNHAHTLLQSLSIDLYDQKLD